MRFTQSRKQSDFARFHPYHTQKYPFCGDVWRWTQSSPHLQQHHCQQLTGHVWRCGAKYIKFYFSLFLRILLLSVIKKYGKMLRISTTTIIRVNNQLFTCAEMI